MNSHQAMSRAQAAMIARVHRTAGPQRFAAAGLTVLAWFLISGAVVALWSLVGFITA